MTPLHTSLYAGVLAVVYVLISYRITVIRRSTKVSLGHGERDDPLLRMVRVHGNFAEYVPFGLVVMALAELSGGHPGAIHALGILLVLGRGLHAYGLSQVAGVSFGRYWGTALTFTVVAFGGLYAAGLTALTLIAG